MRIVWILITEGANQVDQYDCITNNAKNTIANDTEVQVQLCKLRPDFVLFLNALSFTGTQFAEVNADDETAEDLCEIAPILAIDWIIISSSQLNDNEC